MSANAKGENQDMCRQVRREMGRHNVDYSEVQVSASHGIIHLHGRVRSLRGQEGNFESAIASVLKALRQARGIREVHAEWHFLV